jgi:quinol monooxygenase YgiN
MESEHRSTKTGGGVDAPHVGSLGESRSSKGAHDMVILHAILVVKPEARGRWFEILDAVTPPSRAEDACESYVIYEAVDSANTFVFVEEWTSLDGLYAHFHTPHFTDFFTSLAEVIAEPPVGTVSEVSATIALNEALSAAGIGE